MKHIYNIHFTWHSSTRQHWQICEACFGSVALTLTHKHVDTIHGGVETIHGNWLFLGQRLTFWKPRLKQEEQKVKKKKKLLCKLTTYSVGLLLYYLTYGWDLNATLQARYYNETAPEESSFPILFFSLGISTGDSWEMWKNDCWDIDFPDVIHISGDMMSSFASFETLCLGWRL